MSEHVLPDKYNPSKAPLFLFEELDIGQAFMNGYTKDLCIKVSRTMYFNFTDNALCRLTRELLSSPSRIYFKCDYEVW